MQDDRPTGDPDQIPTKCPYGHELKLDVLVGWSPCHCVGAVEGRGHRVYWCEACRKLSDRRRTICYFPPHLPERKEAPHTRR